VAGLVCLYPPFLLYSNLALAECLFVLLFGVVVLLAGRAFAGGSLGWWGALGLAGGALALVHPRGFAVVVAVALMSLLALRTWRAWPSGVALAAGITLSLGISRVVVTATRGPIITGFSAYQPDSIISKSLSAHGAASLLWEAAGQFFYLSVATVGLVPLGLFLGLRSLRGVVHGQRSAANMARGFAALSFLGVWALSSLFMNLGDRADKLIYGRYNEGVIAPLLIIALAEILSPGRLRRFADRAARGFAARRWLVLGTLSTVLSAAALYHGRSRAALHGDLNPINVLALYPLLHHYNDAIEVASFAAVGVAVLFLLALIAWRAPWVTAVLLAAIFVATTMQAETAYLVPGSRARGAQDVIVDTLTRASSQLGLNEPCIGYDPTAATDFNYFETEFRLPAQRFVWFNGSAGATPCGPLVISGNPSFATRYPGARLVTFEEDVDQSLWALPGTVQDRLAAAGWLLPSQTPGELPATAREASLFVPGAEGATTTLRSGATTTVRVLATHEGAGAPWPTDADLHQGTFAVRLSVGWYTPEDLPVGAGLRGNPLRITDVALPRTVLPGETATLSVPLTARTQSGSALAAGLYKVRVLVFQEGAAPFTDPGVVLDVVVR
jgi:hypothetical protein